MNAKQFYELVVVTRQLQKKFLKDRSSSVLSALRKKEKELDEEINRVNRIIEEKKKIEQPTLFGD